MLRLKFILILLVLLAAGRIWAAAPVCQSVFPARVAGASFRSEIKSRLEPQVYEHLLRQVDGLLGQLEPLPEGYSVVLKSHYGQDSKNVFAAKRIEFTEVHTTYQKFTGQEDPHLALAILAHEYSHAYFETTMRKLSPLWEQNSRFLDMPFADPQLKQELALPLTVYHEFFADLVPSLLFKNPAAMVQALQFHESLQPSRALPFRDFTAYEPTRDLGSLKEIFKDRDGGTAYIYLVPLRRFLWKEIQARNPGPEVLARILRQLVEVFARDYQTRIQTKDFGFNKMNTDLEAALREAL